MAHQAIGDVPEQDEAPGILGIFDKRSIRMQTSKLSPIQLELLKIHSFQPS